MIGERTMGELWTSDPPTDVVITLFDLVENRSRFVKSWKPEYATWPIYKAVLASSSVPTYFPVVDGRFVDGASVHMPIPAIWLPTSCSSTSNGIRPKQP